MELTKLQRNALVRAKELRSLPYPVFGTMLKHWKFYMLISVVLGGYSYFSFTQGFSYLAGTALGALIAIFLRDLKVLLIHSKMWPVNVEITDWEKVDRLLKKQRET